MKHIKALIYWIVIIIAPTLLFASNQKTANVWKPLLPGEGFEGWKFDVLDGSDPYLIYKNKDGKLIINGKDNSPAVIQTVKEYSNYELKFEWRWLEEEGGNSGCLIFASTPRFLNVWPKSLEVQMHRQNAGDFIYIGETIQVTEAQRLKDLPPDSWRHRLRINLTDDSENPIGEWNQGHIIAQNGEVTVYINGDLVNKGWDMSASKGSICFQAEGSDVEYRNIKILEK